MKCKFCEYENDNKETICQYCGSYLKIPTLYKEILFAVVLIILGKFLSDLQKFITLLLLVPLSIYGIVVNMKDAAKIQKIRKEHNIDVNQLIKAYIARTEQEETPPTTDNISENEK